MSVDEQGFSMLELLVAAALTAMVCGAVVSVLDPARSAFHVEPEVAELQQRLRVVIDTMTSRIGAAGAGPHGGGQGSLLQVLAPVLPYRAGAQQPDPAVGVFYRDSVLTVRYVPLVAAEGTLRVRIPQAGRVAVLDDRAYCPTPSPASLCGFAADMQAMVYDEVGHFDVVRVTDTRNGTLAFAHDGDLSTAYEAGARIVQLASDTYSVAFDAREDIYRLIRYDGAQTDMPVADHVVRMSFEYFGVAEPPALLGNAVSTASLDSTTYGMSPPAFGVKAFDAWGAGENCLFQVVDGVRTSRLAVLNPRGGLVPLTQAMLEDGPWCPDPASRHRFDADLLRIRRVSIAVRAQVASAAMRGPAGPRFLRGGLGGAATRLVPDVEIRFDVTPRNVNSGG